MRNLAKILKKGASYGAALTRARGRATSGLNNLGSNPGRGSQPASGTISPALRWYRKQALSNQVAGLTCKGTLRQRRPNARTAQERLAMRRERGLRAWNNRLAKFRAQGLTSRGTKRIYLVRRGDALLLKTELDQLAAAISASFNFLSPAAQARALALEASLAVIRRQIL
jgi:hypothetical protein